MNAAQAFKAGLAMSDTVIGMYLGDLTDADLLRRPAPSANHIAWQLGHLIHSEHRICEAVAPGSMPALPTGFAEKYSKETAKSDDPAKFDSKATLLNLMKEQRAGTLALLDKQSDADMDKPGPEAWRRLAPTIGGLFSVVAGHGLMHAGQWVVVRRQLGHGPMF
jgi:uncharacterized damage-inducible protein DinB